MSIDKINIEIRPTSSAAVITHKCNKIIKNTTSKKLGNPINLIRKSTALICCFSNITPKPFTMASDSPIHTRIHTPLCCCCHASCCQPLFFDYIKSLLSFRMYFLMHSYIYIDIDIHIDKTSICVIVSSLMFQQYSSLVSAPILVSGIQYFSTYLII